MGSKTMNNTCQTSKPSTALIDLALPESELLVEINIRLRKFRMELVSTEAALFGDTVKSGSRFGGKSMKPSDEPPRPYQHLEKRRTSPLAVAANLNNGVLPK